MMHSKKIVTYILLSILLYSVGCKDKTKSEREVTKEVMIVDDSNVEKLTQGIGYHWFGYYDKLQVDPTGRYALGMKVNFEGRSPVATDTLEIGMVDLKDNNKWMKLGNSTAWGWQQGCMLQWLPGSKSEVVWNDREGDSFICRIYDIKTKELRTLPKAIYTLSPNGSFALGTEFNRIQDLRPGYGYAGIPDSYAKVKVPEAIGIYKMDLETGENELIISISDIAAIPKDGETLENYWHYFNHLLIAPDNKRFVFLHRWRDAKPNRDGGAGNGFFTRMFSANIDGTDSYLLDPSGKTSHFIWNGNDAICAWTKPYEHPWGFYILHDKSDTIEPIGEGVMTVNGHNTYVPNTNNQWILNDTYPDKEERKQELYLYHVPTDTKVTLGKFLSPERYKGEWRCDLHPRIDPDGTKVFFDSTHEGDGRQLYRIDIGKIIQENKRVK